MARLSKVDDIVVECATQFLVAVQCGLRSCMGFSLPRSSFMPEIFSRLQHQSQSTAPSSCSLRHDESVVGKHAEDSLPVAAEGTFLWGHSLNWLPVQSGGGQFAMKTASGAQDQAVHDSVPIWIACRLPRHSQQASFARAICANSCHDGAGILA